MKLKKFTAATAQQAMLKIRQQLGPDALIISNEKVLTGVEILAGIADGDELEQDVNSSYPLNHSVLDLVSQRLQKLEETLRVFTSRSNDTVQNQLLSQGIETVSKKNILYQTLLQYAFSEKFIKKFIDEMLHAEYFDAGIHKESLSKALSTYLNVETEEFINQKNIIALVGPTGVGKTTTITKLLTRYVLHYDAGSIGLISTDFNQVSSRNLLEHYSEILNVDLEYANNRDDLSLALHSFQRKKIVLIDTSGVGQRDNMNLKKLFDLLKVYRAKVSTYLTMPCNIQASVMDEIVQVFKATPLNGCILTKQDECISMAVVLSIIMYYKLNIAYICDGQNIASDITFANQQNLLNEVLDSEKQDTYVMAAA